jgi:hypothetical protein
MLEELSLCPGWLKEALFVFLRDNLRENTDLDRVSSITTKDSIFLYVPKLTRAGLSFLQNLNYTSEQLDKRFVEFVKSVKKQKNLVDIAQDNDWTLKMACYYVIKAWEKNLILPTYSKNVYALVRLLSGDIELGEYLVRSGKITKEQFAWVSQMKGSGMMNSITEDKSKEEDIFVNLGYLTEGELASIMQIMELANVKEIVDDPNTKLVMKVRDLQKEVVQLQEVNTSLLEEKEEYEKKVRKLSADVEYQKKESMQYYKEIEVLKNELKKALKS